MKKVCFLEFEGLLESEKDYVVESEKAKLFVKGLSDFCLKNNIELFLISGLHENVAVEYFENSFVKNFFVKENFFFVDEDYISSKNENDEKLHRNNLEKDSSFNDSFFKQTIISKILIEKNLQKEDAILFCNDVWVDGYYTMRFSKIDFAIFENNIVDRGKKIEKILGLIYFNFNFSSVKKLLEDFPVVDYSFLEKYVFEVMKGVLMKDVDLNKLKEKIGDKIGN